MLLRYESIQMAQIYLLEMLLGSILDRSMVSLEYIPLLLGYHVQMLHTSKPELLPVPKLVLMTVM